MSRKNNLRRKITVVGGFYDEICHFPDFRARYGSGGRGAAAIPKDVADVELVTFVDGRHENELRGLAEVSEFSVKFESISSIFRFEYLHPLSSPVYFSPSVPPSAPLRAEGDIVLCYGMMEGMPIVKGDTVIYDPQSHNSAVSFRSTGSRAKHLAIIANHSEAETLTGESEPKTAAVAMLEVEKAEVAIVKCGPDGAFVASNEGVSRIAPLATSKVFKIGSGDVFSSLFTNFWAARGLSPARAARNASLATAFYCERVTVPIEWPLPETFKPPTIPRRRTRPIEVYLAGPFFAPQELWMIEECKRHLEQFDLRVFSPFHEIGLGKPSSVAPKDLEALKRCDIVFAVLDGFDSGTLFEIGYAVDEKKTVIGLYHGKDDGNLTMLTGTGCRVYRDISSAVYAAAAKR